MLKNRSKEEWQEHYYQLEISPKNEGKIEMITIRPDFSKRIILNQAELEKNKGVIGDNWSTRGSSKTSDGSSHPDMQVTLMNSRVIHLLTQDRNLWQLAGDQFYVDMDLSEENLPAGTKLKVGNAVVEVTQIPHTGCSKFSTRFGIGALQFVSTNFGRHHRLRGVNCKVISSGKVKTRTRIKKIF